MWEFIFTEHVTFTWYWTSWIALGLVGYLFGLVAYHKWDYRLCGVEALIGVILLSVGWVGLVTLSIVLICAAIVRLCINIHNQLHDKGDSISDRLFNPKWFKWRISLIKKEGESK